jgi:uridine kinase
MRPVIIGVAGGTGSGKTTVVEEIVHRLGPDDVVVIQHDSYYRDRSRLPPEERTRINYDHPDALETPLLVKHLKALQAGQPIEVPVYDWPPVGW